MSQPGSKTSPAAMATKSIVDEHRLLDDLLPEQGAPSEERMSKLRRQGFRGDDSSVLSAARSRKCNLKDEIVKRIARSDEAAAAYAVERRWETAVAA